MGAGYTTHDLEKACGEREIAPVTFKRFTEWMWIVMEMRCDLS